MYLYPYLKTVLLAILEVLACTDTWDAIISLETVRLHKLRVKYALSCCFVDFKVLGWLRKFLQFCVLPSINLSSIASSWALIKSGTILSIAFFLQTTRQVSI